MKEDETGRRSHSSRSSHSSRTSTQTGTSRLRATGERKTYNSRLRVPLAETRGRHTFALILITAFLVVCAGRLFHLQGLDPDAYAAEAAASASRDRTIPAIRGTITDRNGVVLAKSELAVDVVCDPTQIADQKQKWAKRDIVAEISAVLVRHFGGADDEYRELLTAADTRRSVLRKAVPAATFRAMSEDLYKQKLYGVYRENRPIRQYPAKTMAGSLIGFMDHQGQGVAGLEYLLKDQLEGKPGKETFEMGPYGRIPLSTDVLIPPTPGTDFQLTLDSDLQSNVELAVATAVRNSGADWGAALAMNIKTGEIYALAQAPTYDPAQFAQADPKSMANFAVSQAYEPGSVHKLLTMAALADAGKITPDTHVVVPPAIVSGDARITDEDGHGEIRLTARGILSRSSNIGTTLLARNLDRDQYVEYMKKFGLGAKTGVEIPGEIAGFLDSGMTDAMKDRAAFGQSISTTVIQEGAALAGVFNGGMYNPPTIIKSATRSDGKPVIIPRRESRRIISKAASDMTLDMAENVVTVESQGFFGIPNFRLAGKTGTAQRVDPSCGCYKGYVSSYASVGTVEDPSIMVYLVVNNPKGEFMGAKVAAPYVRDVLRMALPKYGVALSTQQPRKGEEEW